MFILASSVCKSLQYLTSALTQGGKSGHLFRLSFSLVLQGGRNAANEHHWRVWGALAVSGSHRVCPAHSVCAFPVYTAQAPGCSAGSCLRRPWVACASQIYAAQVQVLGYSTKARTQLGLRFVPFPGPSSSGDQVLDARALASWAVRLITSPVPAAGLPVCAAEAASQICRCLLWGADLWLRPS